MALYNNVIGPALEFPAFTFRQAETGKLSIWSDLSGVEELCDAIIIPQGRSGKSNIYEIGRLLRDAIYGKVNHAIKLTQHAGEHFFRRTNEHFAIKIIYMTRLRQLHGNIAEDPLKEISALQHIGNHHANIIGQVDCGTDANNIYSIMRFASGGELLDYIQSERGPLHESAARRMLHNILNGLQRLQQLGIAHRDMSVENIMLCLHTHERETRMENNITAYAIIDFGMCILCQRKNGLADVEEDRLTADSFKRIPMYPVLGKAQFIAPEVYDQTATSIHPMSCDMWAIGIILFISLTGIFPMEMAIPADVKYRLIAVDGRLADVVRHWNLNISEGAVDLIQRLLRPNPADRLTLQQARAHPWMNQ